MTEDSNQNIEIRKGLMNSPAAERKDASSSIAQNTGTQFIPYIFNNELFEEFIWNRLVNSMAPGPGISPASDDLDEILERQERAYISALEKQHLCAH